MNTWNEFKCAVNDLKEIADNNPSFTNFDMDDLAAIASKIHEILHILKKNEVSK